MPGVQFIDAEDMVVADLLAALLELVAEAGGWLNPQAHLVERDGELSVQCSAPAGEPLVMIPRDVMVRVGAVDWTVREGMLEIQGLPDDMVGIEREALYLMAGILNQCGKPTVLVSSHPVLAPAMDPTLVDAVRAFRPSFRRTPPSIESLLWSTRCFRGPSDAPAALAVPVIDLLNHSCAAPGAQPQSGGLAVTTWRDGEECFVDYGHRRDAIGMAIVYGFADTSAVVAHSAPLEVEVPGVGRVAVSARGRNSSGALQPVAARVEDSATVLSRVSFGPGWDPVDDVSQATGWSDQDSRLTVEAIATANLELISALEQAAAPFALAGEAAGRTLADAGRIQRLLIEEHMR